MSAVPLQFPYLLCVGVKVDAVDRRAVGTSLVTLALVLSSYALVELAAPGDYIRLLNSCVDRLLLQVWPTAVFTYFIIVPARGGNRLTREAMPWVAAEPGGDGVRTDDTAPFELPVRHTLLERGRHGDSSGERCRGSHECGRGRLPW